MLAIAIGYVVYGLLFAATFLPWAVARWRAGLKLRKVRGHPLPGYKPRFNWQFAGLGLAVVSAVSGLMLVMAMAWDMFGDKIMPGAGVAVKAVLAVGSAISLWCVWAYAQRQKEWV